MLEYKGGIYLKPDFLTIDNIRSCILKYRVDWTNHCLNRLSKRNITISDVKNGINNGKIIEYYYDDYPFSSCLIIGTTINNEIIHIVCGISENFVHMITAYRPDHDRWEDDMKTRRGK
ncbi:MAG: DUF4258 domain-containing protein [Clostridia bacterium]|nr:DUF4258 domain-containing protein [Clostridia bacterium]